MAKLTREELNARLAYDYQVALAMRYQLMDVSAHRTSDDAKAGYRAITNKEDGYRAQHYRVEYRIRTLVGRGRYYDRTVVHIDLLANGNYPYSDPSCWVISKEMPWSPHFKEGAPICIGEIWREAKGRLLLGHLLRHIAKLLNFDEEARGSGYVGWNRAAIRFWKEELNEQPITPNLLYPPFPSDIVHGIGQMQGSSRLFRPRRGDVPLLLAAEKSDLFRPKKV
jgi:hypothetical protein